jgi:hypothetical protein
MPAGLEHALRMIGEVHMRILYVEPGASRQNMPEVSKLVIISPLTRQLILDAARQPMDGSPGGPVGSPYRAHL